MILLTALLAFASPVDAANADEVDASPTDAQLREQLRAVALEQAIRELRDQTCVLSDPPTDPKQIARLEELEVEALRLASDSESTRRREACERQLALYLPVSAELRGAYLQDLPDETIDLLEAELQVRFAAAPNDPTVRQPLRAVLHERHARFLVTATCMLREPFADPEAEAQRQANEVEVRCRKEELRLRAAVQALERAG